MSGGLIGPEYDAQIRGVIRTVDSMKRQIEELTEANTKRKGSAFSEKYGILLEDLPALDEFTALPSTARCRLLTAQSDGTLAESEIVVDVANRSSVSYTEGDYVRISVIAGKWSIQNGGGGGSSATCPCNCIDSGDIIVNGIETTSRWSVKMSVQTFKQANGRIVLPAGMYVLLYSSVSGTWTLDIGGSLTAIYTSGADATVDTTMDGTLTMGFDAYGGPYLTLCVDGTVPAEAP